MPIDGLMNVLIPELVISIGSHKMGLHESSVKRSLKMLVDKGVIHFFQLNTFCALLGLWYGSFGFPGSF